VAEGDNLRLIATLRGAIARTGEQYLVIAERAGVHPSQVSRFMKGQNITLLTAAKLFESLGLGIVFPKLPNPGSDATPALAAETVPAPTPPPPSASGRTPKPKRRR
jgi:hypothetical protein